MAGWFFIGALLLVGAGISKVRDPAPTSGAMAAMGIPTPRLGVIALAFGEVAIGATAVVAGGSVPALLVAAAYGGFTVFVAVALARSVPLQSCGCFGREDTPPGVGHLAFNLAASIGAVAYAISGGDPLITVLAAQPIGGVAFAVFLAVGVYASYLLLDVLPRLQRQVAA